MGVLEMQICTRVYVKMYTVLDNKFESHDSGQKHFSYPIKSNLANNISHSIIPPAQNYSSCIIFKQNDISKLQIFIFKDWDFNIFPTGDNTHYLTILINNFH